MHPQTKWRLKTGVSQGRLSHATGPTRKEIKAGAKGLLGVDQGLISKIEQGASLPGIETAARLCIASAQLSPIVAPLRLTHYLPRELAITYSQTMEAHQHGMAKGGIEEGIRKSGGGEAKEAAPKAVKSTNKRKRARGGSSRGRKAAKATKAGWWWSEEDSRYYRKPKR